MSMVHRQVFMGLFISIILFLLSSVGYFFTFPLSDWSELWERQVMDIPFIISVPSICVAIGILFGAISGITWRRQLQTVDKMLHDLEEGRQIEAKDLHGVVELESISRRIGKIQKQMSEQVKLSQRLTTEKVEGVENQIQEII